jgi:hypothetical protein
VSDTPEVQATPPSAIPPAPSSATPASAKLKPTPLVVVAWAWWGLLAGYLIFNRHFALIGIPPVYIGEVLLAAAGIVLLPRFRSAFIDPLRRSHVFVLVALFFFYGLARSLSDFSTYGLVALRDSVVATYAIAAFFTPALFQALLRPSDTSHENLARHVVRIFWPLSAAAALWAAAIDLGLLSFDAWGGLKPDLLVVSFAIFGWLGFSAAGRAFVLRGESSRSWLHVAVAGLAFLVGIALVFDTPVRAVWVSVLTLALLIFAAEAYSARRQVVLGVIFVFMLSIVVPPIHAELRRQLQGIDNEFQLKADLHAAPADASPAAQPAGDTSVKSVKELFDVDLGQATGSGDAGAMVKAQNVQWRLIFWSRCCAVTSARAPWFGIGFGTNLTDLLQNTRAWPLFVPSQQLSPPNRSPHCAHVTIYTRLGTLGLILWLSILVLLSIRVLRVVWRLRASGTPAERAQAWDGLALFGAWLIWLTTMSFGVVLEGPMGGIWFWSLTGILAEWSSRVGRVELPNPKGSR